MGLIATNEVLNSLLAERLVGGKSSDSPFLSCNEDDHSDVEEIRTETRFVFPPAAQSRAPLKQTPLGGDGSWAAAVGKHAKRHTQKIRKEQEQAGNNNSTGDSAENHWRSRNSGPGTGNNSENPFSKAVKEAERSILVFNLNLGQAPTMNPSTISSKVTVSMLDLMAVKEGKSHGQHSQDAREFVDDLLSQVTKMEFFGSKTAPCKYPGNSNMNGKFYTIPVKLMFRDRKAAQTASELLREHMGINSTTPYHKSLRAAMNMAIAKTKEANPGHHAKVNLDLNGKTLKCFIRTDTKPPGKWSPTGKNIPLPPESMDPTTKISLT